MSTDATTSPGAARRKRNRSRGRTPAEWVLLVLTIVGAALIVFPILLLLINAFKSPADYATSNPSSCRRR